ncbi:Uncharacterised protein [uncultured archaeon]|nr:Uncharacterised protein [uncultured archaeon]
MNYGFGFGPKSTKQIRRETVERNRQQGRAGEEQVKTQYALRGYEMERTGRGSDFRARKRDWLTGRVTESKLVEVKTGNAKTSKLQERTKRKQSNYKVERVRPLFF